MIHTTLSVEKHYKINLLIFVALLSLLLSCSIFCEEPLKKQPNVGTVIINKKINNSWSHIAPLMEFFLDDSIKAIVLLLEIDYGHFGYAQAFNLAHSISTLKKIYNKPVIAYAENWLSHSSYVIASSADYIMVSPLCILGHMTWEETYTDKSAQMSKDGTYLTCIKAGKHKYFANQLCQLTIEDLQILQSNLDSNWQHLINDLIALKPTLAKYKNKWINGEVFIANQGDNSFFVDKIGDKFDLNNFVSELIGQDYENETSIKESYLELEDIEINKDQKPTITILHAQDLLSWQKCLSFHKTLSAAFKEENVLGIIINIDVYGANSGALMYNLYTEIQKLKNIYKKPLVAYIDSLALSGGYWLACCADFIVSSPYAEIGSVGYMWTHTNNVSKNQLNFIAKHVLAANKLGGIFNENKVLDIEGKQVLQYIADSQHAGFIQQIKDARPHMISNENEWKEAQKYTAYKALELGMIDFIGSSLDAVSYITKNNNFKENKIKFKNLTPSEKKIK